MAALLLYGVGSSLCGGGLRGGLIFPIERIRNGFPIFGAFNREEIPGNNMPHLRGAGNSAGKNPAQTREEVQMKLSYAKRAWLPVAQAIHGNQFGGMLPLLVVEEKRSGRTGAGRTREARITARFEGGTVVTISLANEMAEDEDRLGASFVTGRERWLVIGVTAKAWPSGTYSLEDSEKRHFVYSSADVEEMRNDSTWGWHHPRVACDEAGTADHRHR